MLLVSGQIHFDCSFAALEDGLKGDIFNFGNGNGFSVKEVVETSEKITGKRIKMQIGPRRTGDPARLVASSDKAQKVLLGWRPKTSIEDGIRKVYSWYLKG